MERTAGTPLSALRRGVPVASVNWLWTHLPMRLRYNRFARAGYSRG
ncbi:hypothetical protein I553_3886 [Mycobacterium xenopi 4042]|uniref:Uncharacterized protein n=1 Tax=Mycobacterium xenopi 4042 TaxID=1299334 RepID=X8DBX6_MYCXE|nr:hypothetical protein I553_3886 [Mycobacterium xenopi 4042]